MRIPKLRRHVTGRYFVVIHGQTEYLGKDKPKAEARYRALLSSQFSVGPEPELRGITVAELLDRYTAAHLEQCQPRWRTTRRSALGSAQSEARRLYGHLPASQFGPKAFQTVRKAMAGLDMGNPISKKTRQKRCRSHVNGLCQKLKTAWKWGVGQELVPVATWQALACVPGLRPGELGLPEGTDRRPVPADVVARTMPYLHEKAADLVRLLQLTAARPDELVRLRADQIEKQSDGTWTYTPRHHKTAKANRKRVLVFNSEAKTILGKYIMRADQGGYLFPVDASQRWKEGTEPHYRVTSLRNAIQRACVRAKLEPWHPYQIRHSVITDVALRHGTDVAQALAGHSKAAMTAHYDHSMLAKAKKAVG